MDFREAREAIADANETVESGRLVQRQTARLLVGQLRRSGVYEEVLCELKKELAKFNMKTWEWKE